MSQLFPEIHFNNDGYAFHIIEHNVDKQKSGHYKHLVRFIDSGYETLAASYNIKTGKVRDYMQPAVMGIGYLGADPRSFEFSTREHTLWRNMLRRVYGKQRNKAYKDVLISVRWFSFKNFVEDIRTLPGYDKWVLDENYVLDKDILSARLGFKTYSKYTCQFITVKDNLEAMNWSLKLKAAFKKAVDIRTMCNIKQDA